MREICRSVRQIQQRHHIPPGDAAMGPGPLQQGLVVLPLSACRPDVPERDIFRTSPDQRRLHHLGTTITLIADGADEKEAVEALVELVKDNFGE